MKPYAFLTAVVLAAGVAGCGPSRPAPIVMKPDAYAKQMKENILIFVQQSKESPRSVAQRGEVLLETLHDYKKRPQDQNQALYEELLQKAKEIQQTAQKSGDVKPKLDELAALANKLPG